MGRLVVVLALVSGCSLYWESPNDEHPDRRDAGSRIDARYAADARAVVDARPDARVDARPDARPDAAIDAAPDAAYYDAGIHDGGAMVDAPTDAGVPDAGPPVDAGGDPTDSSCIESVQTGPWSGCLHKTPGAAQCWGLGYAGTPANIAGIDSVVEVAPGYLHACARKSDGTVWCWGANTYGQLGDGTNSDSSTPVQVVTALGPLTNAVQIDSGENFACAVRTDHTIWCWGRNYDGQLGSGTNSDRPTASPVTGIANALLVATGAWHTCALRTTGVSCWGYNRYGGLGDGTMTGRNIPVGVSITNVVEVTAGYKHSCARKSDHTLWCWGRNADGQLGNGANADTTSPVQVLAATGTPITAGAHVSAGAYHSCATMTDGTARCWGYNAYGQLGNGTGASSNEGVEVSGMSAASTISTGERHTCAYRTDRFIDCWGQGYDGQLGNASNANSYVPSRTLTSCP
jgi:alpha-tubulin suppressor-like RCC1 family protein